MIAQNRISLLFLTAFAIPTINSTLVSAETTAENKHTCNASAGNSTEEVRCGQEAPADEIANLTGLLCDDACEVCCTPAASRLSYIAAQVAKLFYLRL